MTGISGLDPVKASVDIITIVEVDGNNFSAYSFIIDKKGKIIFTGSEMDFEDSSNGSEPFIIFAEESIVFVKVGDNYAYGEFSGYGFAKADTLKIPVPGGEDTEVEFAKSITFITSGLIEGEDTIDPDIIASDSDTGVGSYVSKRRFDKKLTAMANDTEGFNGDLESFYFYILGLYQDQGFESP